MVGGVRRRDKGLGKLAMWSGVASGGGEGYPQHLGFESRLVLPGCAASDNQFTPAVTLPVFITQEDHTHLTGVLQ